MDIPRQNPELELLTDKSSFIQERQHKEGSAITTTAEKVKAEALPQAWSAQRAELRAFTQVLRRTKGRRVSIYTDTGMPWIFYVYMKPFIKKGDY